MNRATLYHNLQAILDFKNKVHAPASGDMFNSKEEKFDQALKPHPDFSLNDRLWHERRATGSFMSGHPMQLVAGRYEGRVTHRMRDIPDLLEGPAIPVPLAFLVREVRVIFDKIVAIVAEDETGAAEISAFKSDCDPWWHLLKPNYILAAQCVPKHNGKVSSMHFLKLHKLGELRNPKA